MNKELYLKVFIFGILAVVVLSIFMRCQKIEEINENFEGSTECGNRYNSTRDIMNFGAWIHKSGGYHKRSVFKIDDKNLYFPAYGAHGSAKLGPVHYVKPCYSKKPFFQFVYDMLT